MKKIILSLTFLFSIVIIGAAQTSTDSAKFHWGVKAGAGMGKISVSSFSNKSFINKMKLSAYVGAFGQFRLSHLFDIQPEVNISTLNTQTAQTNPNLLVDGQKKTLFYVDVPVLLRINISPTLSFLAGPQVGVLLNNPSSNTGNWYNGGSVTSGQFTFNFPDFSAVGGAQLNFGVVSIQARYVQGVFNVGNNKLLSSSLQNSWRTSQIQLGLGYLLR
jgi:hypothetical protein